MVAVLFWLLFAYPLAVRLNDEGTTGAFVSGAIASVLATLVLAAVVRGIYVWIRKRPFLSPWLFVIAALFAALSLAGQN